MQVSGWAGGEAGAYSHGGKPSCGAEMLNATILFHPLPTANVQARLKGFGLLAEREMSNFPAYDNPGSRSGCPVLPFLKFPQATSLRLGKVLFFQQVKHLDFVLLQVKREVLGRGLLLLDPGSEWCRGLRSLPLFLSRPLAIQVSRLVL